MKIEEVHFLKYNLSDEEKQTLENAKCILRTIDSVVGTCDVYNNDGNHQILSSTDLFATLYCLDEVTKYSDVNLTVCDFN